VANLLRGLYEVLVTEFLERELKQLEERLAVDKVALRPAEVADRVEVHGSA